MKKTNAKLIGIGVAALVVVIVILQNTAAVETRLLFADVSMPLAVLLIVTGGFGFVAGLVVGGRTRRLGGAPDPRR